MSLATCTNLATRTNLATHAIRATLNTCGGYNTREPQAIKRLRRHASDTA